jgi:broad specificity phosphatase PhoE
MGGSLAAQPSLIVLVRHAERDSSPPHDPLLTPAGTLRAHELARALAHVRLGSIIATEYQRTRLTAQPTAESQGLSPILVSAGVSVAEHVAAVAAAIRRRPRDEIVLVVGHNNTIPAVIAALGGPRLPDLCETDHATFFVLHLNENGKPNLVRSKYGADSAMSCDPARGVSFLSALSLTASRTPPARSVFRIRRGSTRSPAPHAPPEDLHGGSYTLDVSVTRRGNMRVMFPQVAAVSAPRG